MQIGEQALEVGRLERIGAHKPLMPATCGVSDRFGRLFGMDVNDNLRSWDDDLVAGTVHPIELFEFYTLR